MNESRIGVYGLGVMGRNLALNLESHGNRVSVFNRMAPGEDHLMRDFVAGEGVGRQIQGTETVEEFVASLEQPRKILIMITAGRPVDLVIDGLLPHLDAGDILIDGGNSHFQDTARRVEHLQDRGILFVGMGVSGGEEGARHGPSLMPGGNEEAWPALRPILEPIAARAFDGSPCCAWMGSGGAGHFVKMVHNGIEYADMQLIAESYHLMSSGLGMQASEIAEQFRAWSNTALGGYLVEITAEILSVHDEEGTPLVEKILDSAGQKGTGRWTGIAALDTGILLPGITQAVFARYASSLVDLRARVADALAGPSPGIAGARAQVVPALADALLASRMVTYAEGFHFITAASAQFGWAVDPATVAHIWQGGCIIRSQLLEEIMAAYRAHPELPHLFLSPSFGRGLGELQNGWRTIVGLAVEYGIPVPNTSAALAEYDTLRSARLPANLIQAQRDYFGAHTYERIDRPRGEFFHTEW
jgi:6-phosphogluconate dehydrogenase